MFWFKYCIIISGSYVSQKGYDVLRISRLMIVFIDSVKLISYVLYC
jgi:hypothetical protein